VRPRFWVEAVPVRVVARRDWDVQTAAVSARMDAADRTPFGLIPAAKSRML